MNRNGWPDCIGIGGRFGSESVAGMPRNMHQVKELEGFGYKVHKDRNILPGKGSAIKEISPDIPSSELRITQRARIHGFRMNSAFFLVWLDKDHQIYH